MMDLFWGWQNGEIKEIITAQMADWIERLLLERYTRGSIQSWVKPMT